MIDRAEESRSPTPTVDGTIVADAVRVREVGTVERTTHNKVGDVTQSVDGLGNETISLYRRRNRLTTVYQRVEKMGRAPRHALFSGFSQTLLGASPIFQRPAMSRRAIRP